MVIADLKRHGYTRRRFSRGSRLHPLQHLQRPRACRGEDLQCLGQDPRSQGEESGQDDRRDGLHGPEGPRNHFQASSLCRPGRRPRPAAHGAQDCLTRSAPARDVRWPSRFRVKMDRKRSSRGATKRSIRFVTPHAADALPGLPENPNRMRQVLHLLRRAQHARSGTGSSRRSRFLPRPETLADQGCREITLLGQTVNSYKYRHDDGSVTDMAALLEQLQPIDGIDRIKFVTNYPKDMTRRLLETDPRSAQGLALSACASTKRIGRGAQTDEAGIHRRRLHGDVRADRGDPARSDGQQ